MNAALAARTRWADLLLRLQQQRQIAGTVKDLLPPAEVSAKVLELHLHLGRDHTARDEIPAATDVGAASEQLFAVSEFELMVQLQT